MPPLNKKSPFFHGKYHHTSAFSYVELLLVVTMASIISSGIAVSFSLIIHKASMTQVTEDLRQIESAKYMWLLDNKKKADEFSYLWDEPTRMLAIAPYCFSFTAPLPPTSDMSYSVAPLHLAPFASVNGLIVESLKTNQEGSHAALIQQRLLKISPAAEQKSESAEISP